MATYDDFVGREEQLEQLHEYAEAWGKRIMVVIEADGGMGKTFLLRKFESEYKDDPRFVIDFYDLAEQPPGDVLEAQHLMDSLGQEARSEFRKSLGVLIRSNEDPQEQEKNRKALFDTAVQELEKVTKERRLIRIVDTLDIGIPDYIWKENEFLRLMRVPNILLVVAGRRAVAGTKRIASIFDQVYRWNLDEFTDEEAIQLFDKDEVSRALMPEDLRRKIHLLSDGRPIYLMLARTWFRHNALPDFIETYSLSELQQLKEDKREEFKKLQEQFRFELVDGIRSLERPADRAVLYMSLLDRHNDPDLLAKLMDIERGEAERILRELAKLPFVKIPYSSDEKCCVLHDEMRELVKQYVWPVIDPWGAYRRDILGHLQGIYQRQLEERRTQASQAESSPDSIAELSQAQWDLWRLEADYLHYLLQLSEEEAYQQFEHWFEDARTQNQDIRMEMLCYEMEQAQDQYIRIWIKLYTVDILRRRRNWQEARNICEQILSDERSLLKHRISAYVNLGWIVAPDSPGDAIGYFKKALRLASQENDPKRLAVIYKNIGQMYRRLYNFEEASKYLQSAQQYAEIADDKRNQASALNMLAYIHMLQGDLDKAQVRCRMALTIRKRLAATRDIAYSYQTLAEIMADTGDYVDSIDYARQAFSLFEKVKDDRGRIQALSTLSRAHRYRGQYVEAEQYLTQAISIAESSLSDKGLLSELYNLGGRGKRAQAEETLQEQNDVAASDRLFQEAREMFRKSIMYGQQVGHKWMIARSRFEIAMTYYYSIGLRDLRVAKKYLDLVLSEGPQVHIFLGHVEELYGLIDADQGDWKKAAHHLGRAVLHLSHTGGRAVRLFKERLSKFLLDDVHGNARVVIASELRLELHSQASIPNGGNGLVEFADLLCQNVIDIFSDTPRTVI